MVSNDIPDSHVVRSALVFSQFEPHARSRAIIRTPLRLWVPDGNAAAYAWLGKLHNAFLGKIAVRLKEGILPGKFRGRLSCGLRGCARQAQIWAAALTDTLPDQISRLTRYPSDRLRIALRTAFRGTRFDLILVVYEPGTSKTIALGERRFFLDKFTVQHYWLQVVKGSQGNGIGTHVIAALMPLYQKWGIARIELTAGLSAGGSVWARFGFVPDPSDWREQVGRIRQNISDIARGPGLSEQVQSALQTAAHLLQNSDNPKVIWAISDFAVRHNKVRLGKLLLSGTRWKGALDLRDSDAVTRLRAEFRRNQISFNALDELVASIGGNIGRGKEDLNDA